MSAPTPKTRDKRRAEALKDGILRELARFEKDNKLEFVYNFRENSLDRETSVLLPGTYRVIFRSKYSNHAAFTVEKRFVVTSGKSVNVKVYN